MRQYLLLFSLILPLHAQDGSPFEVRCLLSSPRRDLSPDRPDTTESPYTIERFQVETGLWAYAKDRSDGVKTETWTFGETNLKAAVSGSADAQLVLRPWISEHTDGEGTVEGFGDIEMRLKWNLWGNDSGKTAGALLPYVSIPTHTDVSTGEWEGGIIFPISVSLTDKLDLAFQVEAARAWNADDSGYDWDFLHSIVLGVSVTETMGVFIEYIGVTGDGPYEAAMDAGVTWNANENLQFDVIVGAGINEAAEDFSISQGVTFRF